MVKPEGFFVTFAVFFGFILVFMVPPMQAPDEQTHFYQAYAVSNFNFVPDKLEYNGVIHFGAELPESVFTAAEVFKSSVAGNPDAKFDLHLLRQYIKQPLNPSTTSHRAGGAGYPPTVYVPQAIGITIGKIFNSSPLIMIWLGRLMNLAAWVLVLYFAIRMLPFAKWAIVILALNPMAVFLSASLSADVMTTALAFLFFSLIASTFVKNKLLSKTKILLILGTLGLLVLTKPVNILFVFLLFAIPWRNLKTKRNYILFCLGMIGAALIIALFWNHLVAEANQVTSQLQRPGMGINPTEQLVGIIHNPLGYINTLLSNYIVVTPGHYGDAVLKTFFGVFGWLDTEIPLWTIVVYIVGLFFALLFQFGRGIALMTYQKLILTAVLALLLVGNITALYLYYTPVGGGVIAGVQGRYFIACSVLLIGLFTGRKKILDIGEKHLSVALGLTTTTVLAMTILIIFLRYYS